MTYNLLIDVKRLMDGHKIVIIFVWSLTYETRLFYKRFVWKILDIIIIDSNKYIFLFLTKRPNVK